MAFQYNYYGDIIAGEQMPASKNTFQLIVKKFSGGVHLRLHFVHNCNLTPAFSVEKTEREEYTS